MTRGWTELTDIQRALRRLAGVLLGAALLGAAAAASQAVALETRVWTGGTGSWDDPTQWSPAGVPGTGDTAVVGSGAVSVDGSVTVGALTHSGGSIGGGHADRERGALLDRRFAR
jgi:hypothetical protein